MQWRFSVPYNQDPDLIQQYLPYAQYVEDVYLPPHPLVLGSGRDSFFTQAAVPQGVPDDYDEQIQRVIDTLDPQQIKVTMLLNASCDGGRYMTAEGFGRLIRYLGQFRGLGGVAVTNILYAERIKAELPHLRVAASVIANIDSLPKARYWESIGRVDAITLSSEINKNLEVLRRIRQGVDCRLAIIVNSGCLSNCPFSQQHYNYLSHADEHHRASPHFYRYENMCKQVIEADPSVLLSSYCIAPSNLHHYAGLVDKLKLVDRGCPTSLIMHNLQRYIEGQSKRIYVGTPWEMDEPDGVFEKVSQCDRDCRRCGWCRRVYEEAVAGESSNVAAGS